MSSGSITTNASLSLDFNPWHACCSFSLVLTRCELDVSKARSRISCSISTRHRSAMTSLIYTVPISVVNWLLGTINWNEKCTSTKSHGVIVTENITFTVNTDTVYRVAHYKQYGKPSGS